MFEKIRKHFVMISTLSVGIILMLILLSMNIANYVTTIEILRNDISAIIASRPGHVETGPSPRNDVSDHYFTVDLSGDVPIYDIHNITRIDVNEMGGLFLMAKDCGKEYGKIASFYFGKNKENDFYVFIDGKETFAGQETFIVTSTMAGLLGYLITIGIIVLSSKHLLKPIEETMQKQKNFVSDASHELKTPLAIISANNELLEMTYGENDSTQAITKQVQRMTGMVKNLTSLAKLSAQEENEKFAAVSLSLLLEKNCETFNKLLARGHRQFNHTILEGIIIKGDEALINQLVGILLENASKYAVSKTDLVLNQVGEEAKLIVSNDAEGIQEGEHPEVFERFNRSSYARASKEGSGIGLAIAKEIITLHHAQIKAYVHDNYFYIEADFKIKK